MEIRVISSSEDLQFVNTPRVLHCLLKICNLRSVVVNIWVSIPCTAGAPVRLKNEKLCAETGDLVLNYKLGDAAVGLCRHAVQIGGRFSWEWSDWH